MKLTIELVPKTAWFTNLRSELLEEQWDILRKRTYRAAGYCCEICGGKGSAWPVECHEIWDYNDEEHIQTLTGLIALCPSCHEVKHIGFAQISGHEERAVDHLMRVNRITRKAALAHIAKAFADWDKRNKHDWKLNLDWVKNSLN